MALRRDDGRTYVVQVKRRIMMAPIVLCIAYIGWPEVMPYRVFDLWAPRGDVGAWTLALGPLLLWAVVLQLGNAAVHWREFQDGPMAMDVLVRGFLMSVVAGFMEEVLFRWVLFLAAIASAVFGNWLVFEWAGQGYGIPAWWQNTVFGPIANVVTFGYLADALVRPAAWATGAALLTMNALFRNGHAYQGFVGTVNSWFLGMYFFWFTFTFGLLGAITAHFAYDLVISVVAAVLCAIAQRRQRAWRP